MTEFSAPFLSLYFPFLIVSSPSLFSLCPFLFLFSDGAGRTRLRRLSRRLRYSLLFFRRTRPICPDSDVGFRRWTRRRHARSSQTGALSSGGRALPSIRPMVMLEACSRNALLMLLPSMERLYTVMGYAKAGKTDVAEKV